MAGHTLTEIPAVWANHPRSVERHWLRCDTSGTGCHDIDGASGQSYTLTGADVGSTIAVREIATNAGGKRSARSAATAVVTNPVVGPSWVASTTSLLASPSAPVTDQVVTLIATVTSTVSTAAPSGAVTFLNAGVPIGGCSNQPVQPTGQSVTVTCTTSFTPSSLQLSAVFSPSGDSRVAGSSSPTEAVTVSPDSTATSLDVSPRADVGLATTYTAIVTPSGNAGPIPPTGVVEFFDGGRPISSCLAQPVVNDGATCSVTYGAPGTHSITAWYGGDADFTGSGAPAQTVVAVRTPLRLITSTMQWTFHFTPTYTTVLALAVNGAPGSTVLVNCRGRGCPYGKRTLVPAKKRCGANRHCTAGQSVALAPAFRSHRLAVGTRITVAITRPGWVGKYYSFVIRSHRNPRISISCLAPGGSRPGVGC